MIIFAYRLAWDTGFAPCLDHNVFTLACCKGGQVRRGKDIFTGLRSGSIAAGIRRIRSMM